MARTAEEKTIRGRTFKVWKLPGMRGIKLFYRLSSVVIPSLTRIGGGLAAFDFNADASSLVKFLPEMYQAATFLFEKLPEAEFERLIKELLETATVVPLDGGEEQSLLPIFDEELAGEVGCVLQLVGFALKVNFGNFLPGLVAQAKSLHAMKAVPDLKE